MAPAAPAVPLSPFDQLIAFIEGAGGRAAVALADAGCSSRRGLAAARSVAPGGAALRVPWSAALTSATALKNPALRGAREEREGRGSRCGARRPRPPSASPALLPGLRWDALHACLRDASLVPHPSILLLALHLLADAAWPASPRRPYARLLPTPAGSALAAVCDAGPAGTDVVLFADSELDGLACAPLARAVRVERGRLQRLRKELLAAGPGPDISFASFAWAHALVRSRALDLSVVAGGEADADAATAPSLRVMLPLLDLAQHATVPSACVLRLVRSPAGEPAAVDLISRAGLAVGAPVCLDYGARPLRDLLRGYAFVPAAGDVVAGGHSEVFEDADADGAVALVVDAGRRERGGGDSGSCMLALDHVRVLAAPGGDTALEGGTARVVWCVRAATGTAARVVTPGDVETESPMSPFDEAAAARRAAAAARALAARLRSAPAPTGRPEHAALAAAYRAARIALLDAAADGCEAQARAVG